MEIKDFLISLTKSVLDTERQGTKLSLPLVHGIKEGKVVLSSALNIGKVDDRFTSLSAGYLAGALKCDAIYYICRSYMRHYSEAEMDFTLKNYATESPEFYPESQRLNSYIFGVADSVNDFTPISYAITNDDNIPKEKNFSIGTCQNFYPQLLGVGYKLENADAVKNAFEVLSAVPSSDLVIIERGKKESEKIYCMAGNSQN
jgi:hypothetical protein